MCIRDRVTAVLSGDIDNTIYGEITAWDLKDTVTNTAEQYQTKMCIRDRYHIVEINAI